MRCFSSRIERLGGPARRGVRRGEWLIANRIDNPHANVRHTRIARCWTLPRGDFSKTLRHQDSVVHPRRFGSDCGVSSVAVTESALENSHREKGLREGPKPAPQTVSVIPRPRSSRSLVLCVHTWGCIESRGSARCRCPSRRYPQRKQLRDRNHRVHELVPHPCTTKSVSVNPLEEKRTA